MMLIVAMAILQLVVSVKPGLVDMVSGETNVREYEQITPGQTIRTGARGHVQISLGWEAYLRLDENSVAVLESTDTNAVAVRMESGSGLIEVADFNKEREIRVTGGGLKTMIASKGLYRFSEKSVSVIRGKLKTYGEPVMEIKKGWELTNVNGSYQRTRLSMDIASEFKRFMNGPKAGFVNAVDGEANVVLHQQVESGESVETGPGGHVELLLAPGSFLRLDEKSSVMLESDFLKDTVVRVVSGSALLESVVTDPRLRIHVIIGSQKARIGSNGLYQFTSNTAWVVDGSLLLEADKMEYTVGKGQHIAATSDSYKMYELAIEEKPDEFDRWSASRSHRLAAANLMAQFGDSRPNFFLFLSRSPLNAAWIYSAGLNGFTVMPVRRYESYYKETFVPLSAYLPPPRLVSVPDPCSSFYNPLCGFPGNPSRLPRRPGVMTPRTKPVPPPQQAPPSRTPAPAPPSKP